MANNEITLESLAEKLQERFDRWNWYNEHGGQDPFYADGVNMNLIRNHINYYKKLIDEMVNGDNREQLSFFGPEYPDVYYIPTPEEVDYNYIANPDWIISTSKEFVSKIKEIPEYQFICDHYDDVFPGDIDNKLTNALKMYIVPVRVIKNYEKTLEKGDLVNLRSTFCYADFNEKVDKIKEIAQQFKTLLEMTAQEKEDLLSSKNKITGFILDDLIEEAESKIALNKSDNTEKFHNFDDLDLEM